MEKFFKKNLQDISAELGDHLVKELEYTTNKIAATSFK